MLNLIYFGCNIYTFSFFYTQKRKVIRLLKSDAKKLVSVCCSYSSETIKYSLFLTVTTCFYLYNALCNFITQKNDEDVRSLADVHNLLLQHIDFNENILPETLPRFFFWPPQLICLDPVQLELIRNLVKDKRPCKFLEIYLNIYLT